MIAATFAVVLNVLGRPSFKHTLDSIARQDLRPGDRVLVCLDSMDQGERPDVKLLVEGYGPQFEYYTLDAGYHFFGVEQCNLVTRVAQQSTCTHLISMGDDDAFVDGALEAIRPHCSADLLRPVIYKILQTGYGLLPEIPAMRRCHISGQCMAHPIPYLGLQDTRLDCTVDFDWMAATIERSGRQPLWLDYVGIVAHQPEHEWGWTDVWRCSRCRGFGYWRQRRTCCGMDVERVPIPIVQEQFTEEQVRAAS